MSLPIPSLFLVTFLGLGSAQAQWGANLTATSDYLFRGFSQTDEGPALQGQLDYRIGDFILAVWASNVEFNQEKDVEVDYSIAYHKGWDNDLNLDLGYVKYTFLDLAGADSDDLWLGLGYKSAGVKVYRGFDVQWTYLELSYDHEFSETWNLGFRGGYWDFDKGGESTDWQISISKALKHIDLEVGYTDTDVEDDPTADARVYLMLARSWTF